VLRSAHLPWLRVCSKLEMNFTECVLLCLWDCGCQTAGPLEVLLSRTAAVSLKIWVHPGTLCFYALLLWLCSCGQQA
jgi:hypothetical protein